MIDFSKLQNDNINALNEMEARSSTIANFVNTGCANDLVLSKDLYDVRSIAPPITLIVH